MELTHRRSLMAESGDDLVSARAQSLRRLKIIGELFVGGDGGGLVAGFELGQRRQFKRAEPPGAWRRRQRLQPRDDIGRRFVIDAVLSGQDSGQAAIWL